MIIALSSQKGGVGKSTILCQLAAYYAGAGKKVVVLDTDKIGTSGNWIEYRSELKGVPRIAFIAAAAGDKLLQTILDLNEVYEMILIDLQGADSGNNRLVLTLADNVIFPFGVSQADLDTLPLIVKMAGTLAVLNKKARFHYVINGAPTTTKREENEAREWFQGHNIEPLKTILHSRKAYRDSMAQGYGVVEMSNDKAKDEILDLINEINLSHHQKTSKPKEHPLEASS